MFMIGPALLLVSVLDIVTSEVMPTALWNVETPETFNKSVSVRPVTSIPSAIVSNLKF